MENTTVAHRFTCGENKIWLNIKNFRNIMKMIVDIGNENTEKSSSKYQRV